MIDHVTTLANAGANNFLVATIAPLEKLPSNQGNPDAAYFGQLAEEFNTLLVSELAVLESSLLIDISILDIHALYNDIIASPQDYGLVNVTDSAYDEVSVVANPDQYLFWDGGHPTTATHAILANAAVEALSSGGIAVPVPEPSTAALTASALVSLLVLALRRKN